jgi:hypothetical protein
MPEPARPDNNSATTAILPGQPPNEASQSASTTKGV